MHYVLTCLSIRLFNVGVKWNLMTTIKEEEEKPLWDHLAIKGVGVLFCNTLGPLLQGWLFIPCMSKHKCKKGYYLKYWCTKFT